MKFSLIPLQVKLIVLAGVIVVIFVSGFKTASYVKNNEIAEIRHEQEVALGKAKTAALTASETARSIEHNMSAELIVAQQRYEEAQNEKAVSDRNIADLRNDVTRLRVSTRASPARPSVPGVAACPAGSDDQAEQTLTGPVAARLAGRYADYNALIDQLELCQATVRADRGLK